jgi:hypothetical protein
MICISVYGDVHWNSGSRTSRQQVAGFAQDSMPESAQYRQANTEEVSFRARLNSDRMLILMWSELCNSPLRRKECDVTPFTDAYEAIKSVPAGRDGTT